MEREMIGNYEAFTKSGRRRTRILLLIAIVTATAATLTAVACFRSGNTLPLAVQIRVFSEEKDTMGKKIHLVNPGPPMTMDQITAFENEIGGRLPDEYKRFLLTQNGGLCEPLLGLPWAGRIDEVGCFYRLMPPTDEYGIRGVRHMRGLNPEKCDGYLPIAGTSSECEICLAYQGNDAGAIYFTAYKYKIAHASDDLIPTDVTMVRLADSFSEFLDDLVEIPTPYCPIEDLGKRGTAEDLEKYLAEGKSINAKGENELTILCEAVRLDNPAMVRACIECGASLSGSIQWAVGNRSIHLIEMLVEAGANINERDEFGHTPLFYVGGTALPGEEGARNRAMRDFLIKLGAVE